MHRHAARATVTGWVSPVRSSHKSDAAAPMEPRTEAAHSTTGKGVA